MASTKKVAPAKAAKKATPAKKAAKPAKAVKKSAPAKTEAAPAKTFGQLGGKGTHPLVALRIAKKVNQSEFWKRVGVTQSGGSRYESGRRMPTPVQMLVDLAYGDEKQRNAVYDKLGLD